MRRANYAEHKDIINAKKRAAYELRQKNRGKKVFITEQAIQKVPLVAPHGVDDQTALFIQESHRELLKFSQTQNNSNEVACLLDLTANERLDFVKGDETSVDIEGDVSSYHWLRTKSAKSIMLCHNHPGQSYYSNQDIGIFMYFDSIGTMSIVTNQGKVWHRKELISVFHLILDGKPMTSKEFDAFLNNLIENGSIPAGQSESDVETAWQQRKGENNGKRRL